MSFSIGRGSWIGRGCKFNGSGLLSIGENTTVHEYCRLDNRASIVIGSSVIISPEAKLLTADHDMNHPQCRGRERGIVLEDFVFIGPNAMVLGGTQMRKGSVLVGNSLLTKSSEAFKIYEGLPAICQSQRRLDTPPSEQ